MTIKLFNNYDLNDNKNIIFFIKGKNFNVDSAQQKNPLHGKTLEIILNFLVKEYGWEYLGQKINIRCFNFDPSIKSSLTFLRKTPWARQKVEDLYVYTISKQELD